MDKKIFKKGEKKIKKCKVEKKSTFKGGSLAGQKFLFLSLKKNLYSIKRIEEKLGIGNICACCGLKDIFNLTVDHIISKEMKKQFKKYKNFDIEKPSNLQLLCWACNTSKNGYSKSCTLQHDNPKIKKMVTKARRRKSKK